jgi:Family of unknown function (DUF6496)
MPSSNVMHEFKHGALHSGSKKGPVVRNRAQAIAIMLSEKRAEQKNGGKYPHRAFGGGLAGLTPGYIERQEARGLAHTGPIASAVGGRTDHHAINVPSGSYVLPAAHVSALGQGNTLNGFAVLSRMFGPPMNVRRGSGPPRLPGMRMPSDVGGARGHGGGQVPIMAAGGEYVLSPDQVGKVGGGHLDHGHRILDEWVKSTHKKLAKTAAKLPPPAKS